MHDRFEKEVQKKMEELNLAPSAPVWEKIEMEIKPDKKKRRGIFWLCLAILLLTGGGYLAIQLANDTVQASHQPGITPIEKTNGGKNPASQEAPGQSNATIPGRGEQQTNEKERSQVEKPEKMPANQAPTIRSAERQLTGDERNDMNPVKKQQATRARIKKTETILPANVSNSRTDGHVKKNQVPSEPETYLTGKVPIEEIETRMTSKVGVLHLDAVSRPEIFRNGVIPLSSDSSLNKKAARNRKWKQQVSFAIGRSSYQSGLPFTSGGNNFDSQPQNTGSIGSSGGVYKPSETAGGLAFSAGYSLTRKLNEHWEISIGVQYAHYSTTTKVGARSQRDTIIQNSSGSFSNSVYYANNGAQAYANRFHVVEMPVVVSYKPMVNIPVFLSLSAAYGRLLSTNELTFSQRSNIYYHNNENYVQDFLPVSTSLQVELFAGKKLSLRIGPSVQYNLKKLRKENAGSPQHLFFAGLKGGISF